MALPNCIIIGVQKGGTTSLFNWLSQHPQIYGEPGMKDFPFFCYEDYYNKGTDWFSTAFKNHKHEKYILHGYVNYLYFDKLSAKRISEHLKDVKLIISLRNPINRAYSAFWQARKQGYENLKSFKTALMAESDRIQGNFEERSSLTYIDHGFYSKQIANFLSVFDKDKIHICLFEELMSDKEKQIKTLFKFLEIDDQFKPDFIKINEAGIPRSEFIQRTISNLRMPDFVKNHIPIKARVLVKQNLKKLNIKQKEYPPLNDEIRKHLSAIYHDEIINLEKLIGIDLNIWKSEFIN